ncbi:hypothetical protein C2E23DRAFT_689548, partial [Lenzites betulinus]
KIPCPHPKCDASFGRRFDLKRHEKSGHRREKSVCPVCPKTFTRKDAAQRHMRT